MFIELIIAVILGIGVGIFSGLCPGIHVNLVSISVVNFSLILTRALSPMQLVVFLISLGITHSFLDFIPSVLLGAPEEATALIVMPCHKLLLSGDGHFAVLLATMGSIISLIALVIFSPLIFLIGKSFFSFIDPYMKYLLLILVFFLVLRNQTLKSKIWSFLIFCLSGSLGIIVMNSSRFSNPLHPLLSGLFGLSVILYSLSSKSVIKEQKNVEYKFKIPKIGVIGSCIGGLITGILPGVTTSIAALLGKVIFRKMDDKDYITLAGGAGTANFIVSLFLFFSAGKTRNGILVGVKEILPEITINHIILYIAVSLIAAGIASFLTIYISRFFSRAMLKVNYNLISIIVALIIVLTVFAFSGWIGCLVLLVSTSIGLLPHFTGVGKYNCMGVLLLPVLLNYLL